MKDKLQISKRQNRILNFQGQKFIQIQNAHLQREVARQVSCFQVNEQLIFEYPCIVMRLRGVVEYLVLNCFEDELLFYKRLALKVVPDDATSRFMLPKVPK